MKTAIIQIAISNDLEKNRAKIKSNIEKCAKAGADLIVLSELHDSPYFCQAEDTENFALAVEIPSAATDYYAAIARENGIVLLASFFEKRAAGLYHNTAVVFEKDGTLAGKYRKMHIPDDPAYYEKFYFTPGDLGFKPIKTSVGNLGVMICFDQWFPEAARLMTLAGADILIYPTAIGWEISDTPEEQQRQCEAWITVQRGHAVANGLPVIACNRVGWEGRDAACRVLTTSVARHVSTTAAGIQFWGSSFAAGAQGEILAQAADNEEENLLVDIDFSHTEKVRQVWTFLRDRRIDAYEGILKRFID